jgi:hypothetical protein
LPSPIIESPPDGPFELDSSFSAPDLSSLITPSLLDEFESMKRSFPSTTVSDNFHLIQSFSQSACTPVTNPNIPQFSSYNPLPKHSEYLAFNPIHVSSGGMVQLPTSEPMRHAGAVIIPSNLLKGGIVQQSVVGQVPFKSEPLPNTTFAPSIIASSLVKSEIPLSLQQLLNSSNELQYLSNTEKHSQNTTNPLGPADRLIPLPTAPISSFSTPNIAQTAVSSNTGLIPFANSSFTHTPHSSAPSFDSDLASIPIFRV